MKEEIINVIENILTKMGFQAEVESFEVAKEQDPQNPHLLVGDVGINVKTDIDSQLLIGRAGTNLSALEYIIRLIVRNKLEKDIQFVLDINSYRQEKNKLIIREAYQAAKYALNEKRAVVMKEMNPYERRLVHMILSTNQKISTESIGDEENGRKVVIKPAMVV